MSPPEVVFCVVGARKKCFRKWVEEKQLLNLKIVLENTKCLYKTKRMLVQMRLFNPSKQSKENNPICATKIRFKTL